MPTAHDEIFKSALALPEQERILLATELLGSLPGSSPGLSIDAPGFEAELDRRFNDSSKPASWELVSRRLEEDLNK
jgi:hypothetical protein